jgi:hypothetical protein
MRHALVAAALLAGTLSAASSRADPVCDNAPLPDAPTIKVLVFGDSLTAGSAGDYTWRYRYWQQQRAAGINVEFLGPITGMMGTADYPVSNNEAYADPCFDQRAHWAIGGKKLAATFRPPWWLSTTPGAPSEIAWAVENYHPDVVVEFMGGNDLVHAPTATPDQVIDEAHNFVSEVRKGDVTTDVAVVTTTSNGIAVAETYNTELKAQAPGWSTPDSQVGVIDVMRDWQGAADTWDGVHPHANGEMHLAWDVADGLSAMGYGAPGPRPIPVVPLGPRTPPVLRLGHIDATSVTLGWTVAPGTDHEIVWRRDLTSGTAWSVVEETVVAAGTTISGLSAHRYAFRIQGAKGTVAAQDLYSDVVTADLRPISLPRVGVPRARSRYRAVSLSWPAVSGAYSYRVRWHRLGSSAWHHRIVYGPRVRIDSLRAGVRYGFRVRALHAQSSGPESVQTVARPRRRAG